MSNGIGEQKGNLLPPWYEPGIAELKTFKEQYYGENGPIQRR
jgi:hypothetical protein